MSQIRITSPDDNVIGQTTMEVKEIPLYIAPSKIDYKSPEMYNYDGEQLFFIEVPYEALAIAGVEKGAESLRRVMTLAKMEKNIAAAGKSHKINPAYGIETAKVESFTFKLKDGKTMTAIPQGNQYQFYANKGVAKILGVLEQAGNILDFVSILKWGMNSSDKKELLPIPGPLGVLNLPMKRYFDDIEEALEEVAIKQLDIAKEQGINAVGKLINLPNYRKMGYDLRDVSDETIQRVFNMEIKTGSEFINAVYLNDKKTCQVLYRIIETKKDVILIIETFFFNID